MGDGIKSKEAERVNQKIFEEYNIHSSEVEQVWYNFMYKLKETCETETNVEEYRKLIIQEKRHSYAEITMFIHKLDGSEETLVLTNCESMVAHCSEGDELLDNLKKLLDHINLALRQKEAMDDMFQRHADEMSKVQQDLINKFKNSESKINEYEKKISDTESKMMTQLISIVSIFVAISFVMFGGMSMLNSLFDMSNVNSINQLFTLICLGSLMALVVIIMLYLFLYYIYRLTKNDKFIWNDAVIQLALIILFSVFIGSLLLSIYSQ